MKFSRSDFALMRWNLLAFAAALLIGATALYAGNQYAEKAHKDRRIAQNRLNEARNRLITANEDQKNMAAYAGEYGALIEGNIIGDGHRLDWIEGLENIRRQNLVTDFRYNIAPQKIYAPQPPISGGNFDIHYSEMKLQFDLLHEGQLLDFFTALRKQIKGKYQLEGCSMQQTAAASDDDGSPAATRLRAECSGGWVTLKNRKGTQ